MSDANDELPTEMDTGLMEFDEGRPSPEEQFRLFRQSVAGHPENNLLKLLHESDLSPVQQEVFKPVLEVSWQQMLAAKTPDDFYQATQIDQPRMLEEAQRQYEKEQWQKKHPHLTDIQGGIRKMWQFVMGGK